MRKTQRIVSLQSERIKTKCSSLRRCASAIAWLQSVEKKRQHERRAHCRPQNEPCSRPWRSMISVKCASLASCALSRHTIVEPAMTRSSSRARLVWETLGAVNGYLRQISALQNCKLLARSTTTSPRRIERFFVLGPTPCSTHMS